MDEEEEGIGDPADLFKEPEDYYQPDKPATYVTHELRDGRAVHLRLVGHNPLWGHLLWNAGQVVADYIEDNFRLLIKGKTVLELGAGSGLPSLVCAIHGAQKVVVTDYPDPDLIENLRENIKHCDLISSKSAIAAEGFLWGSAVEAVKAHLDDFSGAFDLLILADILFNHSEHEKLVATLRETLKSNTGIALVFFTPYRPWLLQKDLHFFDLARDAGFVVDKILEKTMKKVMFETDPGDELLRRTVFGYRVTWPHGIGRT